MFTSINARLHETALVAACLFVVLTLTSCGVPGARPDPTATPMPPPTDTPAAPTLTPTPTITPTPEPAVFVVPSGTDMEKKVVFAESIPQNNCGGTSEAKTTIGKSRTIKYELDVGGEFTVYGEGELGVPGIGRVKAGAAVAAQYNVGYGTAEEKTIDVELKAASRTRVEHQLTHYELWDKGIILVTLQDHEARIPYKFPREYRIEYVTIELPCPTDASNSPIRDVTPESTVAPATPTAIIQPTPSSTRDVGSEQTPVSSPPLQCGSGAFVDQDSPHPLFMRPNGYLSGWITSDPSDLVLPDGSLYTILERYVLFVDELPEIQLRNVPMSDSDTNAWGCWYRADVSDRARSDADTEYRKMLEDSSPALYRISIDGIQKLLPVETEAPHIPQPTPRATDTFAWVMNYVNVLDGTVLTWHPCPGETTNSCAQWTMEEHNDGLPIAVEILHCTQDGTWIDDSRVEHEPLEPGTYARISGMTIRRCAISAPPPTPQPTAFPTIDAETCVSKYLDAGKQVVVTLTDGCYYHFNVACDGCVGGEEDNYVIRYGGDGINVTVPEGSVWQYGSIPDKSDVCKEEVDHWPARLPSFLAVSGVEQLFPCQ